MNLPYIGLVPTQYRLAFVNKLNYIANVLGVNPVWLMILFYSESRLQPQVINSIGCAGLIQFCPNGGQSVVKLNTNQIASLNIVEQLDLVLKYFYPYKGKIKSLKDLYLINLSPLDFDQRNNYSYKVGSKSGLNFARLVAQQNKPFDYNKDGYITIGDIDNYLNKQYGAILSKYGAGANNKNFGLFLIILALLYEI